MIGKSEQRIDAYEKATGKAQFTDDLFNKFPDMLHIRALRSPYAHAKIKKLDIHIAEKMHGVSCVITGKTEGIKWELFPAVSRVAGDETIWAGQAVALVAARTPEIAELAIEAIDVEFEPLPHVLTWRESLENDPVSVVDGKNEFKPTITGFSSKNIVGDFLLKNGDVASGFSSCSAIVEGEFQTGKKTHNQLERAVAIAEYTANGEIVMWSGGCGAHSVVKRQICDIFGLPESKVRVIQPYTGGSFGNRNKPYIEVLAALVSIRTKRTACFQFSRKEMFIAAPSNWACATKIRLGANREGKLMAKDVFLVDEIGATTGDSGETGLFSSSSLCSIYSIPNVNMRTCALLTNTVPAGPYRGMGSPEASFGMEILIDELAEKLDMNPLEFRLKNLVSRGEADDYGETVASIGVGECLRAVAHAIDLNTPPVQDGGIWKKGKGIACASKQNAPKGRSEAEIRCNSDGSVQLLISCDNHGMGASTALAQIAAHELGLEVKDIEVIKTDTALTAFDNNSAGSNAIYRTGNAVLFACEDLITQLKRAAAKHTGVSTAMVSISGGFAHITGSYVDKIPIPHLFEGHDRFVQENHGLKQGSYVRGWGVFSPAPSVKLDENGRSPRFWSWFQYAAAAVEIAVNSETGQIKILRIANACDSGNPINPSLIESQIDGSSHMAIGFCLHEEHIYGENGEICNANMGDYRLPLITDMPICNNVFSLICSDPLPDGPYGAKGISESTISAIGPAIASALRRAIGIRMLSYPMTAERVLQAIREREGK